MERLLKTDILPHHFQLENGTRFELRRMGGN